MTGLSLFAECETAAQNYSGSESVDICVICVDGSRHLYVNGEEKVVPWLGVSMPVKPLGEPVAELDLTPLRVESGRWSEEIDGFIPSRKMSVPEFLNLAGMIKKTK